MPGFIHKYYDWSAFESFVSDLYAGEGDVIIERNVIDVDQYGARRETDVKITRRTRLHTYVTLVECKRWKEPVGRDRIDVLAASVEALKAQKGALFTTTGYEEGALKYAQGKNIDVFVVRDLKDEEWGAPGREIQFYAHFWSGTFTSISVPNAQMIALIDEPPASLNLNISMDRDRASDPEYDLYSVKTGKAGPNITNILVDAHSLLLRAISPAVRVLADGKDGVSLMLAVDCEFNLEGYEYKQLRLAVGAIRVPKIGFSFIARANQMNFTFDRGTTVDFALVIENYLSEKRYIAHRRTGVPELTFNEIRTGSGGSGSPSTDVVKRGDLITILTAPWVGPDRRKPDFTGQIDTSIRIDVVDEGGRPRLSLARFDRGKAA